VFQNTKRKLINKMDKIISIQKVKAESIRTTINTLVEKKRVEYFCFLYLFFSGLENRKFLFEIQIETVNYF